MGSRRDAEGFDSWTRKVGTWHVQPPHSITDAMVTLRVHLDAVDNDNAPLRVFPGSHRLGRLDEPAIKALAHRALPLVCLAEAGDVWSYRSAIVHASLEQRKDATRRVLQLDYSADELPAGLSWALESFAQNPLKNSATLAPSASTA